MSTVTKKSYTLGNNEYLDASGIVFKPSEALDPKSLQEHLEYSGAHTTITIGTVSDDLVISRKSWVVEIAAVVGASTGTPFSGVSSGDTIFTVPSGYRTSKQLIIPAVMRSKSTYEDSDYIPVIMVFNTDGTVIVRGNETDMQSMRYLMFTAVYTAAG